MADLLRFELCNVCLPKYRQLSYDPACDYGINIIPLCSIYWPDEHPDRAKWLSTVTGPGNEHSACRRSIFKLLNARDSLWCKEGVPEESQTLWDDAHRVLPQWPGFHRLSLTQEQAKAVVAAHMDLANGLNSCEEGSVEFTETDDGVMFQIKAQGQKKPPRKWWPFWR